MTLISPDNTFAMGAVLVGLAWVGFYIDTRPIGRKTSGVIWVLGVAMLLSNFGVTPLDAPVYGFVGGTLVPLAIPLLLLKADLRAIFRESGRVMAVFMVAASAVVAGALIGYFMLDLGEIGPKVAGMYTGGWIGGAVNQLAVSQAVQMTDTEYSVALSASNLVSVTALAMLILIPSARWITKHIPSKYLDELSEHEKSELTEEEPTRFVLVDVAGALALSFAICAVAGYIGELWGKPQYNILIITVLTLIVANLMPGLLKSIQGDFELGMFFMYVFFAMVGSATDATLFLESALILFVYGLIIVAVHFLVLLPVAKIFKFDLAETVVASGAALVGPAATAAIAISKGWRSLVTPAIMCGVFGYAIGTFIGYGLSCALSGGALCE